MKTRLHLVAGVLMWSLTIGNSLADKRLGATAIFNQPSRIEAWEKFTGQGAEFIQDGLLYSSWTDWQSSGNPPGTGNAVYNLNSHWGAFPYKDRMELHIGMFPTALLNDPSRWTAIQDVQNSPYKPYFVGLANQLKDTAYGNATLRLAWEFNLNNGGTFPWRVVNPTAPADPNNPSLTQATAFINAWRNIRTWMSVAGTSFKWAWNVGVVEDFFNATQCYPGDAYVDYVSVDVYDSAGEYYWDIPAPWQAPLVPAQLQAKREHAWKKLSEGRLWDDPTQSYSAPNTYRGLNFYRSFAASHSKPFIISEWGIANTWVLKQGFPGSTNQADYNVSPILGSGDNAYFITQMYNWIASNNVFATSYFNSYKADEYDHSLTATPLGVTNPNARSAYLASFVNAGFASPPIFSDDFNDGNDNGWAKDPGGWTVLGGSYSVNLPGSPKQAVGGGSSMSSYTFKADVRQTNPWKVLNLLFYWQTNNTGYRLETRTDFNGTVVDLALFANNTELKRVNIASSAIQIGSAPQKFSIAAAPVGSSLNFVIKVGSTTFLTYTHATPLSTNGKVGFRSTEWSQDFVDNIEVIPNSQASATPVSVLEADDFQAAVQYGWTADASGWVRTLDQYGEGVFSVAYPASVKSATIGLPSWSNYTISTRLSTQNQWHGVSVLALINGTNGYRVEFKTGYTNEFYQCALYKNGSGTAVATYIAPAILHIDLTYVAQLGTVKVSTEGTGMRVKAWLGNVALIDYLDPSPTTTSGPAGVQSSNWTLGFVDDFCVFKN